MRLILTIFLLSWFNTLPTTNMEHKWASHTHDPLSFGPTPPEYARAQEIADPSLISIVSSNQESQLNGAHTRRKSCYTPKANQEVSDSPCQRSGIGGSHSPEKVRGEGKSSVRSARHEWARRAPTADPTPVRTGLGSGRSWRPGNVLFLRHEDTHPVENLYQVGVRRVTAPRHCSLREAQGGAASL